MSTFLFASSGVARHELASRLYNNRHFRDNALAQHLNKLGLESHREANELIKLDLATEGRLHTEPMKELKRWCVFDFVVRSECAKASAEMASFLQSELDEVKSTKQLVYITLRRRNGLNNVLTTEIALHHKEFMSQIGSMLTYTASKFTGVLEPLTHAVHHRMLKTGDTIDLHSHLTLYVEKGRLGNEALNWFRIYFSKHFSVYESFTRTETSDYETACSKASYERAGFSIQHSEQEADMTPWIAEYVRSIHVNNHLHRRVSLGSLRKHISELTANRQKPILILSTTLNPETSDQPKVEYVSIKPLRPKRKYSTTKKSHGIKVLCARLSWIGNELRPVLLVRQTGTSYSPADLWQKCTELYDLSYLIEQARESLTRNLTK